MVRGAWRYGSGRAPRSRSLPLSALQTTLIQLTTALGLLAVASVIVDYVMLNLCATRSLLRQYKSRLTGDTSELPPVRTQRSSVSPERRARTKVCSPCRNSCLRPSSSSSTKTRMRLTPPFRRLSNRCVRVCAEGSSLACAHALWPRAAVVQALRERGPARTVRQANPLAVSEIALSPMGTARSDEAQAAAQTPSWK